MTQKTETMILEAAFALFAVKPTATLAEVAKKADVGRATLHRLFKGRDDLMAALAHRAMAELDQAVDQATKNAANFTDGLRLTLEAMIPLAERQLFLANEPVDHMPSVAKELAKQRAELTDLVEAAKHEGSFDNAVPTAWIAQSFEALTYAAWTMVCEGEATPKQASALAWRTLTIGVKGDAK
ncbi:helix-turn-helix domain-containing protein [Shimia thalassica]|uniref:TetR/AcrR family transcriptional regulator n=1 Tax=Shimia thalassica TaxID=1715693 RepID=UPI002734673C|nr:helix-turn-helix domain-containing protein [Shimia thalassica]MDP2581089.1 helix-turn-helix domain-containing protein [Shimia thalassica]